MKKNYLFLLFVFPLIAATVNPAKALIFRQKIDSIDIVFNRNQLVLPGESFEIGVVSHHKKGKTRKTIGTEGGYLFWRQYEVEVRGGTFKSGEITVNKQLMPSKGKYISVNIWPKKYPAKKKEILIPLNYEKTLEFIPVSDFDKAPGSKIRGNLVATFNNGMRRVYKNPGHQIKEFNITTSGGHWKNEVFMLDPDFTNIPDHKATMKILSLRNPSVIETFTVELDYKHDYQLFFQAGDGTSGFSGSNGSSGTLGDNGNHGSHGGNGEPGFRGPDIGVWTDLYYDSLLNCFLMYVYAENLDTGESFRYLINPDGGTLTVTTEGGDGGSGGNGGHGGNGGAGIDGAVWWEEKVIRKTVREARTRMVTKKVKKRSRDMEGNIIVEEIEIQEPEIYYVDVEKDEVNYIQRRRPGQNGGDGGDGGDGGLGGEGGDGGDIYFNFTDDAQIFENIFSGISRGGLGGKHGSGGIGGRRGRGGCGEPAGRNGGGGSDGAESVGWAFDGRKGKISKSLIDEIFFSIPGEDTSVSIMGSVF